MTIAIKNNKTWNPGVEQLLVHNNPDLIPSKKSTILWAYGPTASIFYGI